jgi:glycine/D-amino acid oxidase-like deaminating enzyme
MKRNSPVLDTPAWDDARWTPLPRLASKIQADVCVIGLGGSGLTCIHALVERGARVVGIDATSVGGGAAGRNGGFLLAGTSEFYHDSVQSLGRERARAIYQLTIDEIERIAAQTPELVFRTGSLRIAGSDEEEKDCERQLEALRADAFPGEHYEGPEGRGLLVPGDASFQPLARCRILATRAVSAGARLFEHSPAVDVRSGYVRTPDGIIECEKVVVAVDGRLEALLPELSSRIRTARLQMLATAPSPEVSLPRPVYSRYGYDYWQQLPDKRIVVGGCRDAFAEDEWTNELITSEALQARLERLLREKIGSTQPITHRWAALVSYSNNEVPVLEEVRPGVIAIGAYSGTGNVVGALYGRIAAELAATGTSSLAGVVKTPARPRSAISSASAYK